MPRATVPSLSRRVATCAGFLLAALAILWSVYLLVMPPLLVGIVGSTPSGIDRLSWLIGAAYATPSILCAAAGAVGAVVVSGSRAILGGVLVAVGWACFAALLCLFVAPNWLA
jgi:hypothetical protein